MSYQIETNRFIDIRGIPIIALILSYDNNKQYSFIFYQNTNNEFVSENLFKLNKHIEFLIDSKLITLSLPVYEYTKFCLKLTPKALVMTL